MSAPDIYYLEPEGLAEVLSPSLVIFHSLLEQNLDRMTAIAASPDRLRPHCKTHKVSEVVQLQRDRGITKHKCATFPEAEMLANAGVNDILLAYNLVGPNIERAVRFCEYYPQARLAVTADDEPSIRQLGAALAHAGQQVDVLLDVDTGQHRTGVPLDDRAAELYRLIADTDGLRAAGLHLYDGQNHQTDVDQRRAAVLEIWRATCEFRDRLKQQQLSVPRLVAGGSGSFPMFAEIDDPALELSPGTVAYFDAGYRDLFPDLPFVPAALMLTRVISRPTPRRVTLDLGYKAVSSDQPAGRRVVFPDVPDAKEVLHNEEHLVIETGRAADFAPGDCLLAIPRHICPCSALHSQVYVARDGVVTECWRVTARDRQLKI